jgi:hypothetical protein
MEGVILPLMPNKKTVPTKEAKTAKTAKTNGGETHQQAATDVLLTTNQGLPISDNQNSLKGGGRGPTLLEILFCVKKSRILTTNVFRNASCTREVRARTDIFSRISL